MYDLPALEDTLTGTIFAGKLHYSRSTGSTNTDAIKSGRAAAPHGSVYFADEQTAGRGRGDHHWQSTAGEGLYVSVLLRPSVPIAHLAIIPMVAGLAAANAIQVTSDLTVDLRWPNDLLIAEHKVGGILVESKTERGDVSFVVIGIGINVHQREFVPDLSTPASSLDLKAGRRASRQALLITLLESLERETSMLHDTAVVAAIPARVAGNSTWLWNRKVAVHGPQACVGITAGLDKHGFLRVETAEGVVTVRTGGIRAAD